MINRQEKRYVKRKVESVQDLRADITDRFMDALFDENDNRSYKELFKEFNEEYKTKATLLNQKNNSKLQANVYGFHDTFYPIEAN